MAWPGLPRALLQLGCSSPHSRFSTISHRLRGISRVTSSDHNMRCSSLFSTNISDGLKESASEQSEFNRAAEKRLDTNWLSEVFLNSAVIIPLLHRKNLVKCGQPVVLQSPSFPTKKFMEMGCLTRPIFLGLTQDTNKAIFAVDISTIHSTDLDALQCLEGTEWVDLRRYGSQLSTSDAGLLAYARGMVEWHMRNKFCGHCGEKMDSKGGGHSLQCSSADCGVSAYPRLDPAIIVLVSCGDFVLLGRQSKWDQGRYSLLAGFVEVGETFEKAVAREVCEESGVYLEHETVRYIASQPWPFPSSLMVGFMASAKVKTDTLMLEHEVLDDVVPVGDLGLSILRQQNSLPDINVDLHELEDARWIHRSFLHAVIHGIKPSGTNFSIPGKHAIAHSLMRQWITDANGMQWAGNQISTVVIDEGIFKYVLVRVYDSDGNEKLIVRGDKKFAYHSEILKNIKEKLQDMDLQVQALGGGRIKHVLNESMIHVYGFSMAYGRANHAVTVALLQQWFPFHKISFSWDGY